MPVTAAAPPRPARSPRTRPIRWVSGRSLALHLTVLLVVPVCLLAGWWQIQRALAGNTLSFVYVFEWPAFAGVALWAWWVLLTAPARREDGPGPVVAVPGRTPRPSLLELRSRPLRWDAAAESGSLREYNAYLAEINARPRRGRPPRRPSRGGRPWDRTGPVGPGGQHRGEHD